MNQPIFHGDGEVWEEMEVELTILGNKLELPKILLGNVEVLDELESCFQGVGRYFYQKKSFVV